MASAIVTTAELIGITADVIFQKIWMRSLPELDLVGGPAQGQVCIVTGPTSGIGIETASELARRGAHVVLACRTISKGEELAENIRAQAAATGQPRPLVDVMELDLNSLASVKNFGKAWEAKNLPLNILINNAGVFSMGAARSETADGFESHLGTNHLAHFLLTMLLVPSLIAGYEKSGKRSRVVNVSSRVHRIGQIDRKDPHFKTGGFTPMHAYGRSKLSQVLISEEITRRSNGKIMCVALHPGNIMTNVVRTLPAAIQTAYRLLLSTILLTPSQGARCSVYCATSPDLDTEKRKDCYYYDSNCQPTSRVSIENEQDTKEWLWNWSAAEVGLEAPDTLL